MHFNTDSNDTARLLTKTAIFVVKKYKFGFHANKRDAYIAKLYNFTFPFDVQHR